MTSPARPANMQASVLPPHAGRALAQTVYALAAVKLVVHLAFAPGYGYFRDELYYLACARRLAWGYVDHPPLSIALLAIERSILGESLVALRFFPAIAGAVLVVLAGWLARELRGGLVAQTLAAFAVVVAPEYLALHHYYSMNAYDLLFWTLAACVLARILREREKPRPASLQVWMMLGVVLGLGLLNKLSVMWWIGGVGVGLIATRARRLLLGPGPWIAFAIAALLLVPHVMWQVSNGWPTREFMKHATEEKMAGASPLAFVLAQITDLHPLNAVLWVPGLGALLYAKRLERWRTLGIAYVAILIFLIVNQKSRTGYLAPFYPVLFAAGGVVFEEWNAKRRWLAPTFATLLAIGGIVTAPLALPSLPVATYIAYARALGQTPSTEEKKELGKLPQFYADMFGWREMTDAVEQVVLTLSPEEKKDAIIFANDYGQAGAFELFGRGRALPPVASGHNNYWLWGTGGSSCLVVIVLSNHPETLDVLHDRCGEVEPRGAFHHDLVMPYENDMTIYVCKRPRVPISQRWASLKHYD